MTINKALHLRENIVRLYVSRKEGGRGLTSIKDNKKAKKIDYTQQNSKCMFCCERDETINHIISEYCKSTKKSIRVDMTRQ